MPEPKLIVTTEKDKARLVDIDKLSDEVKENIYALPIKVSFMLDKEETFNKKNNILCTKKFKKQHLG